MEVRAASVNIKHGALAAAHTDGVPAGAAQPSPPADKNEATVGPCSPALGADVSHHGPRCAAHKASGALIGAVDDVCSFQASLRCRAPWPTSCSPIAHPRHRHAPSRQHGTTSIGNGRVGGGGEDPHGALGVCWENTQHPDEQTFVCDPLVDPNWKKGEKRQGMRSERGFPSCSMCILSTQ